MKFSDFTQLWKEEPECLIDYAKTVPKGGTIVEIGTADGGTAGLLYEAIHKKDVQIYTVDIAPTQTAYQILKNTSVNIISSDSSSSADRWDKEVKKPINFLLIDGNHSFLSLYKDFFSWVPYLAADAIVAFHDYDPPERGGIAHFGVKVFIDTLIEKHLLKDISHEYRLLFCRLKTSNKISLSIHTFFNTFLKIGADINSVKKRVFRKSVDQGIDIIRKRNTGIDSLQASYCIEHLINGYYELLLKYSNDKNETMRWFEMFSMLNHAYGESDFPNELKHILPPSNETEMSRMIAKEHIKMQILKNILKTVIPWTP